MLPSDVERWCLPKNHTVFISLGFHFVHRFSVFTASSEEAAVHEGDAVACEMPEDPGVDVACQCEPSVADASCQAPEIENVEVPADVIEDLIRRVGALENARVLMVNSLE